MKGVRCVPVGIIGTELRKRGITQRQLYERVVTVYGVEVSQTAIRDYCRVWVDDAWDSYRWPEVRRAIELSLRDFGIEIEGINAGKEYEDDEF